MHHASKFGDTLETFYRRCVSTMLSRFQQALEQHQQQEDTLP